MVLKWITSPPGGTDGTLGITEVRPIWSLLASMDMVLSNAMAPFDSLNDADDDCLNLF